LRKRWAGLAAFGLLLAVLSGCGGESGQLVVYVTGSPNVAEDPLDPAVVRWLRVRVEGPKMGVVTVEGPFEKGGSTRLPRIEAGPMRRIVVEGLTGEAGLLVSRGESLPFEMTGGHHEIELYMGLVERFSAVAAGGLDPARMGAAVLVDTDGMVLVTGGAESGDADAPAGALGRVERFDPTSGRLVDPLACAGDPDCAIAARWHHMAVSTSAGVLILGGADDAGPVEALGHCLAGSCMDSAVVPLPRVGGRVAEIPGGGAWILGGHDGERPSRRVDHVDATGALLAGAGDLPSDVPGLGAAVDGSGALWILGFDDGRARVGHAASRLMVFSEVDALEDRHHAALVALEDGRVLVVGGREATGGGIGTIELIDGAAGRICEVGALLRPRWKHAATRLGDGRILVSGGMTAPGLPTAEAEILDPRHLASGGSCERLAGRLEVRPAPRMLQARSGHALMPLRTGAALVVGGQDSRGRPVGAMELFVPGR
jgi:hypothetical protein